MTRGSMVAIPRRRCRRTECGLLEEGEACQGGLSKLPSFASPGSASFTGGVNIAPAVGETKQSRPRRNRSR